MKNAGCRRGFSLIEMLTVLFVISILVSFVMGMARHASRAAETRRAQADLNLLADALERYFLRFGDYPPDAQYDFEATKMLAHTQLLPGRADDYYFFSNSLPRTFTAFDPWQQPYRYELHRDAATDVAEAPETFELYSLGPDKTEHTHDDIRF